MKKKRVSVTLDTTAVKHARAMGLNLSYELNVALAELVKGTRTPAGIRIMFLERSNAELRRRLRELNVGVRHDVHRGVKRWLD